MRQGWKGAGAARLATAASPEVLALDSEAGQVSLKALHMLETWVEGALASAGVHLHMHSRLISVSMSTVRRNHG
jgi:hypothetical protein